jgi:recombinational DNA repair ATPase RecF
MELQELQIQNFRGIKGDYSLEPSCGNAIIVGPNGSGKSSVLEAINYLLTGSIRQLERPGIGSVDKDEIIRNLNADGDCIVSATFEDSNTGDEAGVQRSIEANGFNPPREDLPDSLQHVIETAQQGQHILTRDDLLDLIITQPKSRREVLSELLNLPDIDDRRLSLKRTRQNLKKELEDAQAKRQNTYERLQEFADSDAEEDHELRRDLVAVVNELRGSFGGDPIDEIDPDSVREDLESPLEALSAQALRRDRPKEELKKFDSWLDRLEEDLVAELERLDSLLEECREWESADVSAKRLELLELGEDVIPPDADACPLCQQDWDEDTPLHEDIRRRREELRKFQGLLDDLKDLQDSIIKHLKEGRDHLSYLVKELDGDEYPEVEDLETFEQTVEQSLEALRGDLIEGRRFDPLDIPICNTEALGIELAEGQIFVATESLMSRTEESEDLSEAEEQYEDIGSIAERWQEYEELDDEVDRLRSLKNDIETAEEAFIESRREVIGEIYEDITDRVESYYCSIHPDEDGTEASIKVTDTGAELKKEFYDAGEYPPHSVFSEGHLDSLGLCLHLALTDYLQRDEESLLLLDDVVMSVDRDHRLQIARMIADEFAEDYQIIITTHDELWAEQLRSQGALYGGTEIWLDPWSLDVGVTDSRIGIDVEQQWATVEEAMAEKEIKKAAHELRYATEKMLEQSTISLNAAIDYDQRQRYTLEDYKKAVCRALRDLTSDAKNKLDQTGEDAEHFEDARELGDAYGETLQDVSERLSKVNRRVHWTPGKWLTIGPEEFREVFQLHKEAYNLLYCDNCGSSIRYLNLDDYHELRCNCREHWDIRWN